MKNPLSNPKSPFIWRDVIRLSLIIVGVRVVTGFVVSGTESMPVQSAKYILSNIVAFTVAGCVGRSDKSKRYMNLSVGAALVWGGMSLLNIWAFELSAVFTMIMEDMAVTCFSILAGGGLSLLICPHKKIEKGSGKGVISPMKEKGSVL